MSATSQAAAGRDIRNNSLSRSARFQVAVPVREAHYRTRIRHVDVLRVGAKRIEGNAKGLRQTSRVYFHGPRLAIRAFAAQHADASRFAFRHEQIAIGRAPDEPRILQTRDVLGDGESRHSLRPGIRGPWDDMRAVVRRLRAIRLRQVG